MGKLRANLMFSTRVQSHTQQGQFSIPNRIEVAHDPVLKICNDLLGERVCVSRGNQGQGQGQGRGQGQGQGHCGAVNGDK